MPINTTTTTTTGTALTVDADSLTTGKGIQVISDSSDTSARNLVEIKNDNTAAVGATAISVTNDAIASTAGQTVLIESTAAETNPLLRLRNSNAAVDKPAIFELQRSDTSAEAANMDLGKIQWTGVDAGNNATTYASVLAEASAVTAGSEEGKLTFGLATTSSGAHETVLTLQGGANAAGSTTTVAGNLVSTGAVTANAGVVVDNITIDGTEIDLSSGDLTIDVAGDIALSADGGNVTMDDGQGVTVFDFDVDGTALTIHDDQDTGDKFSITVAQHGATTIATVDDDATAANLVFDVDGDIELNADGGEVNIKDASAAIAAFSNQSGQGELRLHEAANFVGFKAPSLSGDQIWTLPAADGSSGQQLTTNGSGVLSWAAAGAGGSGDGSMTSVKLNNSAVGGADIVTLDFSSNFTATEDPDTEIQIGIAPAQTTITSILATDIKIGEDDETKIDFETANAIHFYADNHNLIALTDANDGDAVLTVPTADKNFTIKGTDGSSAITALDIDMAAAGDATFNAKVTSGAGGFVVGSTVITDDSIVMTPSSGDTATIAAATNGALSITTVDTAAAAANIQITADGTAELAGTTVTLDSGADVVLSAAGGNVTMDDGTTTIFDFNTADTSLTIHDDQDTGDKLTITVAQHGATTIATEDDDATAAHLTLDADGDIVLDAASGDIKIAAAGTTILGISNSSSDVIIKPIVDAKDIIFQQRDGTEVARVEDNGTFNVVTDKLAINGTAITSTAAELNVLDGITAVVGELNALDLGSTAVGTAIASKAVILDSNKDYTGLRNFTVTGELQGGSLDIDGAVAIDPGGSANVTITHTDPDANALVLSAVGNTTGHALTVDMNSQTSGNAIFIDIDNDVATNGNHVKGMVMDIDLTGDVANSEAINATAIDIDMDMDNTGRHTGSTANMIGMKIHMQYENNEGISTGKGIVIDMVNTGNNGSNDDQGTTTAIEVNDGNIHLMDGCSYVLGSDGDLMISHDNAAGNALIDHGTNGNFTIENKGDQSGNNIIMKLGTNTGTTNFVVADSGDGVHLKVNSKGAMDLTSTETDGNEAFKITASQTTKDALKIVGDSLTTHSLINVSSDSSDSSNQRSLVNINNSHNSATQVVPLYVGNAADSVNGTAIAMFNGKTDGIQIKSKEVVISTPASGTTVDATGFLNLPGRKFLGLTVKVTTAIPGGKYISKIGVGNDDDLFGTFADNVLEQEDDNQSLTEQVFYNMGSAGTENLRLTFNLAPGADTGRVRATVFYLEQMPA